MKGLRCSANGTRPVKCTFRFSLSHFRARRGGPTLGLALGRAKARPSARPRSGPPRLARKWSLSKPAIRSEICAQSAVSPQQLSCASSRDPCVPFCRFLSRAAFAPRAPWAPSPCPCPSAPAPSQPCPCPSAPLSRPCPCPSQPGHGRSLGTVFVFFDKEDRGRNESTTEGAIQSINRVDRMKAFRIYRPL